MATSPACLVKNGTSSFVTTLDGVNVTNGNVISIQLADPSQVDTWSLEITGVDEITTTPTLSGVDSVTHVASNPNATVTFVMPAGADARALIFKSVATGGGVSTSTTFGVYSLTGEGERVGALGEELEGSHLHGWLTKVNPLIRAGSGGGGGGSFSGNAVEIQTVPVNTTLPVTGMTLVFDGSEYTPTALTADMIQPGFLATLSGGGVVEVGSTVSTPSFTASYVSGPPSTATLTDNSGSTNPKTVTSTPTSFSSSGTFTQTTVNSSYTFTLTATKGTVSKTSTVSYAWRPKILYDAKTPPGSYNAAFLQTLTFNTLASSRQTTFTVNASTGQKIYFSVPSSYGTADFFVGGFEGGFSLVASAISLTNTFGVTLPYDLYESTNAGLGSTTVQVT